jgi:hypothetical protein
MLFAGKAELSGNLRHALRTSGHAKRVRDLTDVERWPMFRKKKKYDSCRWGNASSHCCFYKGRS